MTEAALDPTPDSPAAPLHLRRRHRLAGSRQYQAVYAARVRKRRGPLTVFARPNDLAHHRLGLSVGRRVGGAVTRNAIKRRLREAFRLLQHDHPLALDLVINVTPHETKSLGAYRRDLDQAWGDLEREWKRRRERGVSP